MSRISTPIAVGSDADLVIFDLEKH